LFAQDQNPSPADNTLHFKIGKPDINQAFLSKTSSGWSLPLKDGTAIQKYNHTIEKLYKFYAHPNEELYRLMEVLGPASGWRGKFPTHLEAGDFE
jgi:hypothetical protein